MYKYIDTHTFLSIRYKSRITFHASRFFLSPHLRGEKDYLFFFISKKETRFRQSVFYHHSLVEIHILLYACFFSNAIKTGIRWCWSKWSFSTTLYDIYICIQYQSASTPQLFCRTLNQYLFEQFYLWNSK